MSHGDLSKLRMDVRKAMIAYLDAMGLPEFDSHGLAYDFERKLARVTEKILKVGANAVPKSG